MRLLLESEVATLLRCSREKVKRLRLSGKLKYAPGRPVLIDEADLKVYLDEIKCLHPSSTEPITAASTPTGQKESEAAAKAWALKTTLLRNRGSRTGS